MWCIYTSRSTVFIHNLQTEIFTALEALHTLCRSRTKKPTFPLFTKSCSHSRFSCSFSSNVFLLPTQARSSPDEMNHIKGQSRALRGENFELLRSTTQFLFPVLRENCRPTQVRECIFNSRGWRRKNNSRGRLHPPHQSTNASQLFLAYCFSFN